MDNKEVYEELPSLGYDDPHTILNVLCTSFLKGRYLVDALHYGQKHTEYYRDSDLAIGVAINVFGRKIVLNDCDPFTKEYYSKKYGHGFIGGYFMKRTQIRKPGQEIYTSEPPECFGPQDFYVGNILILHSFESSLVDADEYTLRCMEANCQEFMKSNVILIMNKIREALKPMYKQFVCGFLKTDSNQIDVICCTKLSKMLKEILGDSITQHELITLARHYSAQCIKERYTKESLRSVVHTELKRFLFNQMERLHESFLQQDPNRSGYISRDTAYAICRGAKLPVDRYLLNAVLDKICKNEAGEIDYRDLLRFLDPKQCPPSPAKPTSSQYEFSLLADKPDNRIGPVDCQAFLKDLDLEKQIVEESG